MYGLYITTVPCLSCCAGEAAAILYFSCDEFVCSYLYRFIGPGTASHKPKMRAAIFLMLFGLSVVDSFGLTHTMPPCARRIKHASSLSERPIVMSANQAGILRPFWSRAISHFRPFILSLALLASGLDTSKVHNYFANQPEVHRISSSYCTAFVDSKTQTSFQNTPNVMLSMSTIASKNRLAAIVSGAYVAIWAFFFFTHDKGEKSE